MQTKEKSKSCGSRLLPLKPRILDQMSFFQKILSIFEDMTAVALDSEELGQIDEF